MGRHEEQKGNRIKTANGINCWCSTHENDSHHNNHAMVNRDKTSNNIL